MDKVGEIANHYLQVLAKNNNYFYHIVPENLKGDKLIPLSKLEQQFPKIYKEEIKKYKGREKHLQEKISPLNCTWKDVISFSSINPQKLFDLENLLGLKVNPAKIIKFPVSVLEDKEFCFYFDSIKNEKYEKGSIKNYKETLFIPPETTIHYAECKDKNDLPLLFAGVLHILVKDEISIKDGEIIKAL